MGPVVFVGVVKGPAGFRGEPVDPSGVSHPDNAAIQARPRAAKSVFLWRDCVKMESRSAARAKTNTGGGVEERPLDSPGF